MTRSPCAVLSLAFLPASVPRHDPHAPGHRTSKGVQATIGRTRLILWDCGQRRCVSAQRPNSAASSRLLDGSRFAAGDTARGLNVAVALTLRRHAPVPALFAMCLIVPPKWRRRRGVMFFVAPTLSHVPERKLNALHEISLDGCSGRSTDRTNTIRKSID